MVGQDTTLKSADYAPTNAAYGEIVKGIGGACAVPENARVPIHWVLVVFTARMKGAGDAELNALMAKFRTIAAEAGK
jgi:hypothetical protein